MDENLKIIRKTAHDCAEERFLALWQVPAHELPDGWIAELNDKDIDHAGQMVGRPLDEAELVTFAHSFCAEFARLCRAAKESP